MKRNPLDEAIERVLRVYRDEKEDFVEAMFLQRLIERLEALKPNFDYVTTDKNWKSRHAKQKRWKKDVEVLLSTYHRCKRLCDSGQCKSWEKAYEQVCVETGLDYETIKKRCLKARKLLKTPAVSWGM